MNIRATSDGINVVEITTLCWSVLPPGQRLGLRGYDALRRASTEQLSDDEPVAASDS